MVNKAMPITETLYLRHSLLFFFYNTIRYFVYINDALQINHKINNIKDQQT